MWLAGGPSFEPSSAPSSHIFFAPAPPSSAGWKMNVMGFGRCGSCASMEVSVRSIAVCPSWPQACMMPGVFDAYVQSVCSVIGSASVSARKAMARWFVLLVLMSVAGRCARTPVPPARFGTCWMECLRRCSTMRLCVRCSW